MAYFVSIALRAERDFANLYEHINAEHSNAALKWYRGLKCGTQLNPARDRGEM